MTGTLFRYTTTTFDAERKNVTFSFELETDARTIEFNETLEFPAPLQKTKEIETLIAHLHIALGMSYYKSLVPPKIDHMYTMSELDAGFWNSVFLNGLGEFLYVNSIDPTKLAKFSSQQGKSSTQNNNVTEWTNMVQLGIGGGKDSIVAGEMLLESGLQVEGFILATKSNTGQALAVADVMKIRTNIVKRQIDTQLIELNSQPDVHNGHVPISVIFALCGCILAANSHSRYAVVANEASASIPQIIHGESTVNHQWSKSFEFEKMFHEYIHHTVSPELHYFSAVRQLSSVAIARIFSHYPEYFSVFTSDNSVFRIDSASQPNTRWSIESPKTLSSFILLAPWIHDNDLQKIFGFNPLEKPELIELLVNLLGGSSTAVLDCVGTPSELRTSLGLLFEQGRYSTTPLMSHAYDNGLVDESPQTTLQEFLVLSTQHAIPETIQNQITTYIQGKLA